MDVRPAFTLQRLAWQDAVLDTIALPRATLTILQSFGSGLSRRRSDPPGIVWAVGDRGPNLKVDTLVERYGADHLRPLGDLSGAKVMPRPDIGPRIAKLRVHADRVELLTSFAVSDAKGDQLSGLPMPGSEHAVHEPALSLAGAMIEGDPAGMDSEGLVALEDGSFILSEEFGPSLVRVDAAGRVLGRFVPADAPAEGARYPVHPLLPAIAARRQLNRGFEAISVSEDQLSLFVAFQSPLAHPDEAAHAKARHVRLWRLDVAAMEVAAQYLYPLDPPDTFLRDRARGPLHWSDLKVSELICLPDDSHLVLERGSHTTKIYRVRLSDALALQAEELDLATRPTIEERSAAGEPLPALTKQLLFSSDHTRELSPDLEGMVVLSPTELLLVNDNDFGVEGAQTAFWKLSLPEPFYSSAPPSPRAG
jgi:hypothetical protein